jgi:hypothetical protein
MKFLKDEKGMTKPQLVIVAVVVMIIIAFSLVLVIGEDGFSFRTKDKELKSGNNVSNNTVVDNTVYGK